MHTHPRACIAVVLDGAVRKTFARSSDDAAFGTVVTMPPAEPHEDVFGRDGATIVVLETDDGAQSVATFRDWNAALIALRLARELADPDRFTALAVEGLGLELAAVALRAPAARPGRWLDSARELLHDRFRRPPSTRELARQLGVGPLVLAQAFQEQFGESPGAYARRVRLEWAADRLVRTDVSVASLALEAGFVDQSHLTRAFKRQFGIPPARFRRAHR